MLPGQTYQQATFPQFKVSMGANSPQLNARRWTTTPEPPIWSSTSLFGRGTSVWQLFSQSAGGLWGGCWKLTYTVKSRLGAILESRSSEMVGLHFIPPPVAQPSLLQ